MTRRLSHSAPMRDKRPAVLILGHACNLNRPTIQTSINLGSGLANIALIIILRMILIAECVLKIKQ